MSRWVNYTVSLELADGVDEEKYYRVLCDQTNLDPNEDEVLDIFVTRL